MERKKVTKRKSKVLSKKIKGAPHKPDFLNSIFRLYYPSLIALKEIDERIKKVSLIKDSSGNHNTNVAVSEIMRIRPEPGEIIMMVFGLTELISVCEEAVKQYKDKDIRLVTDLHKLSLKFNYREIRNILSHWEDYSRGIGYYQKLKKLPRSNFFVRVSNESEFSIDFNGKYKNGMKHIKIKVGDLYTEIKNIIDRSYKVISFAMAERDK